jgi:hypothetical protein
VNLLAVSVPGAWLKTRMAPRSLYRIIAVLLIVIAAVMLLHGDSTSHPPLFTGTGQIVAGVLAGLVIGVIASLLGVVPTASLLPLLAALLLVSSIRSGGTVDRSDTAPGCAATPERAVTPTRSFRGSSPGWLRLRPLRRMPPRSSSS